MRDIIAAALGLLFSFTWIIWAPPYMLIRWIWIRLGTREQCPAMEVTYPNPKDKHETLMHRCSRPMGHIVSHRDETTGRAWSWWK